MEDGDVFASTHRAHGHTLARGTHPNAVMAELFGKLEGCSHGYGGSMHLYDVERGNLGANAVVAGGIPSIVGAGLAFKLRDEPRVARRVLRRRRDEHRHLPRGAQPRPALEDADGLRLREQRVGRVDARLAALAGLRRHVEARARVRHARDQGRRPGRGGGLRARPRGARARALGRGPRLPRRRDLPDARPLHRRPAGLPHEGGPGRGRRARPDRAPAREARGLVRGVGGARGRGRRRRRGRGRVRPATAPTRSPRTR